MIWYDRTQRSIVVGCRRCGAREIVRDQTQADTWATAHLERAHPTEDNRLAVTASRVRRHRRAG